MFSIFGCWVRSDGVIECDINQMTKCKPKINGLKIDFSPVTLEHMPGNKEKNEEIEVVKLCCGCGECERNDWKVNFVRAQFPDKVFKSWWWWHWAQWIGCKRCSPFLRRCLRFRVGIRQFWLANNKFFKRRRAPKLLNVRAFTSSWTTEWDKDNWDVRVHKRKTTIEIIASERCYQHEKQNYITLKFGEATGK